MTPNVDGMEIKEKELFNDFNHRLPIDHPIYPRLLSPLYLGEIVMG